MAWLLTPEVVLCVSALAVLVVDSFPRFAKARVAGWTACVLLAAVLAILIMPERGGFPEIFAGDLVHRPIGRVFEILILVAGLGCALLCLDYFRDDLVNSGRVAALLVFSLLGMFVLVASRNLLVLYLGLELMTFSVYLAVSSGKGQGRNPALEASVKYFLMGGVASALFLFGVSLIYASGGTLALSDLGSLVVGEGRGTALAGIILMGVAVFFKLSVFPLHFWTPDAYEGAPTPVSAFMATSVKGASFFFLFKVLFALVMVAPQLWAQLVATLCVLTMTWGNWVAFHQKSLNRLLAYSSIAHVGYMLMVVTLLRHDGVMWIGPVPSLIFYLGAYMAMTLGVFAVFSGCRLRTLDEVKGLSRRAPFASAALALFLLSLTGIPPTAGFLAKFFVFMDALSGGWVMLAVAGALNSALAAFYYLKIIRASYFEEGKKAGSVRLSWEPALVISVCAVLVLLLGIWPSSLRVITHLIS